MNAVDIILKGGPVMGALLLFSLFVCTVIVHKAAQFWRMRIWDTAFMAPAVNEFAEGDIKVAMTRLARVRHPAAKVMAAAMELSTRNTLSPERRDAEILRIGAREVQKMEAFLRSLELAATATPLLGLLGTVTGIIAAFARLEEAGSRVDPSLLAGGIWEALIATATGLLIAIPAMVAYHTLDAQVERARATMRDGVGQILAAADVRRNIAAAEMHKRQEATQRAQKAESESAAQHSLKASTLHLLNPRYT